MSKKSFKNCIAIVLVVIMVVVGIKINSCRSTTTVPDITTITTIDVDSTTVTIDSTVVE